MAGFTVNPDLSELIRRAQLQRSLQNVNGSGVANAPVTPPSVPAVQPESGGQLPLGNRLTVAPSPPQVAPSPREEAIGNYRQALQEQAPNPSDYHPSLARRLGGLALGIIGGMHDPATGARVGHDVVYGPFDQKMSAYQEKLAKAKTAFEEENKAADSESKINAEIERASAEKSRAGAEEARKKGEEYKNSPEGQAFELKKLGIQHPNLGSRNTIKPPQPFKLLLNNGESLNVLRDENTGTYTSPDGTKIGLDAIKEAHPLEAKEAKETPPKAPSTPEEQAIAAYAKKVNKKPEDLSYDERTKAHAEWAQSGETPALKFQRTQVADRARDAEGEASYNRYASVLTRDFSTVETSLQKYSELDALLKQGNPQSDALVAPKLLSTVVGGQGSGLRMNAVEIARAVGGRTQWEALQAAVNKWSTDPAHAIIPDEQRKQIHALADALRKKITSRQKTIIDTDKELGSTNDPTKHKKIMNDYKQKLADLDSGGGEDQTSKATHKFNPQTGKIEEIK